MFLKFNDSKPALSPFPFQLKFWAHESVITYRNIRLVVSLTQEPPITHRLLIYNTADKQYTSTFMIKIKMTSGINTLPQLDGI